MIKDIELFMGDCMEKLKEIPDKSVHLVLTDPPYNVGVTTVKNTKTYTNKWDKIPNYIDWSLQWLKECQRILKPNGVLYFWHNNMATISELLEAIKVQTDLELASFCIWDKGDAFRAQSWHKRDPEGRTALRSWFNVCEYCLHFFNAPRSAESNWKHTGTDRINSNPECYRPLKEWYSSEKSRIGITDEDVAKKYTEITGRKPYMLRHYFKDSQFEIPTKKIFESVYEPLGFEFTNGPRQGYEAMRQEYETMRNYHRCDDMHCNIWHVPPIPSNKRFHTCQKPVPILERLIKVSCPPGGIVLDCFMGSGSTGVACVNAGRKFIGIEREPEYFQVAKKRINDAAEIFAYTE